MKRILACLFALLLLASVLCLPAGSLAECKHRWKLVEVVRKATCTEKGLGIYECQKCKDVKRDYIKATGHSWGRWRTTKEPTCGKEGTKIRTCLTCGAANKETIPATGNHTYKDTVVKKPTCGTAGLSQQVCSVCGHKGKTSEIPATGKHTYKIVVVKKPTCGTKGLSQLVCSVCGYKGKTAEIPATGKHSFSKWKTARTATCEENGLETRTCQVCKLRQTRKTAPLGHDWDGGILIKEPTDTEDGEILFTCRRDPSHTKTETLGNELQIIRQPEGGTISHAARETITLSVTATGGVKPYAYTWYEDKPYEDNIEMLPVVHWAHGSSSLTLDEGGKTYFCIVTDAAGASARSDSVTVNSEFFIASQPVDMTLTNAATYPDCRAAGGVPFANGTYIYAWYDENGTQISFSDEGGVRITEEGNYYCIIEDSEGNSLTTNTIRVAADVLEPFRCIWSTAPVYLREGEEFELSAEFDGGKRFYSGAWTRDGEALPTEFYEDHTVFATFIRGDGSEEVRYVCNAEDAEGRKLTAETFVRRQHLTLTEQPQSGELDADGVYTLRVKEEGGEMPMTYRVYRMADDNPGVPVLRFIQTLSSDTFSLPVTVPGQYWFEVIDATGCWIETEWATVE